MNQPQQKMLSNLAGIFFISGLSALIYQVCWQRLLFTGFGVDLTSITVIVSAFMAGLGVGAFFGGRIADKYPQNFILIFCLIELGIGCFGFFSHKFIFFVQICEATVKQTCTKTLIKLVYLVPPISRRWNKNS